jgi:hypothetical protein
VATLLEVAALTSTGIASAMRSTELGPGLCETNGGGRFVEIPGFPGERIDRRLLDDIRMFDRRYSIFITDGYSRDPVHAATGEHPLGLALDIVPDKAAGGRWSDIGRLARWAEPRQNRPRAPFRWVGYNGDAGHGRGHHLHLSWNHSPTKPGNKAQTVYTMRCPGTGKPASGGGTGTGGGTGSESDGGGTAVGESPSEGGKGSGNGTRSGGIGGKFKHARPVVETGGMDAPS